MKEVQNNEYYGDNDQRVNPTACARKSWTDVPAKKAEKPQYYKNYDDEPDKRHEISPLPSFVPNTSSAADHE